MASVSKAVKKRGAQTQSGNMKHPDCPCTQTGKKGMRPDGKQKQN